MTNEEKKAIERLDYFEPDDLVECAMYRDCVDTILNLIEKQSKQIEELFAENQSLKYTNGNMIHKDVVKVNYTPNDKIKAKIEEIEEEKRHYLEINDEYNAQICDCIIEEYKSLLEKE